MIPDTAKESIGPKSGMGPPPAPPPITMVSMAPQPVPQPAPPPQVPVAVNMMPVRPPPQMVVPAPPMFMTPAAPHQMGPPAHFGMQAMQPQQAPPPMMLPPEMDEPPNKKARGEETLMPEADFLARNVSPVTFRVVVPNAGDKPEWKLHGQLLTLTLPLSDPISALKARIHEDTGMPPGKQKLQMENIFFKDSNTLAYYNIYPNTIVHLQIKERGGRKK